MHGLRNARRFGRLLAVWLLLWFVAMATTGVPPALGTGDAQVAAALAGAHVDHEGHHGHAAEESAGDDTEVAVNVHAGHASGSPSHCPLCAHGAAPPPTQFAPAPAGEVATDPAAAPGAAPPRVRTDAPPPARGPPLLS
ncbi:hypothetical protein GCM10028796_18270 [Ramlibacter monticola]|uniref:DUF2946 domain-containing protein n=1 Tax=Ramlibacter monticola TaxID=1926872 RepID=A0A936YWB1_9BURK|nr:DUF2946 family protein [Ramlibacter monticola]MBL0390654.1 hypothetical protein [Ramlibacter monticola]